MKVLLIGNGAREHAIAETLKKSSQTALHSYLKSRNPGIISLSESFEMGNYNDFGKIKNFVQKTKPDFAFIGPEEPLSHGVVDLLKGVNIPSIGPSKSLARLETSKSFTRKIMEKYKIEGNPRFGIFDKKNISEAKPFIGSLDMCVIKPDGLTGGKGVKVQGDHFKTKKEAFEYCNEVLQTHPAVIAEEKLDGEEFSLQCLTDGKTVVATPPVQDHKRAFVDDKGPNCYSADTEILTENGWKTFDKLKNNEKVMTFNSKKKLLSYEKPRHIYWMKYNGKMIHFKHRELDLLVTPNHRMLVKSRKTNKIKVLKGGKFIGENEILLTGNWKGKSPKYFIIDEYDYKFNRKLKRQKIKFIDWIRFMGLFLSEGYLSNRKGEYRVHICQTKKSKYFEDFKKILKKLPFRFSYEKKDAKFRINSVLLVNVLNKFGTSRNKFVPDYIKNAKKEHIIEFLKAFMLSDGSVHHERMRFHSGSRKLIDDIQELILKIGKSGIITIDKRTKMLNPINKKCYKANKVYSIEIKPETKVGIRKKDIKEINYNGYVGCVNVPSSFVIVRRNNRVAISGNTGGMGSYSCEDHLLPFLTKKDVEDGLGITQKVANALYKETGEFYKGVMYAGLIVTKKGVKLIEYNARFGDPEAMNILPLMETDFADVCNAIINQELHKTNVKFRKNATVCKYLVPEGYPNNPAKNEKIEIGKIPNGARIYYAAVEQKSSGIYTTGSRAVGCLGIADDLENAEKIAELATKSAKGKLFHRKDIGTGRLVSKRVRHMKKILSR
jgi:phosphoribosylamine-glycine ligase